MNKNLNQAHHSKFNSVFFLNKNYPKFHPTKSRFFFLKKKKKQLEPLVSATTPCLTKPANLISISHLTNTHKKKTHNPILIQS